MYFYYFIIIIAGIVHVVKNKAQITYDACRSQNHKPDYVPIIQQVTENHYQLVARQNHSRVLRDMENYYCQAQLQLAISLEIELS